MALALVAVPLISQAVPAPRLPKNQALSFTEANAYYMAVSSRDQEWHKRWWIEKTARLLRGQDGLGPEDNLNELLRMSEEQIARKFMEDPRFGESVLDFNLYYLGFKPDQLKDENGNFELAAFDFGNAVQSAQELLKGGDYLKLWDFEGPLYWTPLPELNEEDYALFNPEFRGKPGRIVRAWLLDRIGRLHGDLNQAALNERTNQGLCTKATKFLADYTAFTHKYGNETGRAFGESGDDRWFLRLGIFHGFDHDNDNDTRPGNALALAIHKECANNGRGGDMPALKREIRAQNTIFRGFWREIYNFEPSNYKPQTVAQIRPFNLNVFPHTKGKWLNFSWEQTTAITNSSTNINRKRSAYVLKHYFCDDLTPVGFENPAEHVRGPHGSNTSCFACHYKLDPMAGFFRNIGYFFVDYSNNKKLVFDDRVTIDRNQYHAAHWRSANPVRQWNIGYIRSARAEDQNSYGESFSDLARIVRSAPEAKRCLMRRLFEYMVAENQTIDGGYLHHITEQFDAESKVNSSEAFKNAVVRILQSQSYNKPHLDPNKCYDYAPGARAENSPPCRVAFILRRNCIKCHDNAYDMATNLDLSAWVMSPDGKNHTFPHLNDMYQQRPVLESLTVIAERLSTSNPDLRMPRRATMESQERQELYLWIQGEIARIQRGGQ